MYERRGFAACGWRWLVLGLVLLGLSACDSMRYYGQAVHGHLSLLHAARPLDDWLDDAQAAPQLKQRLEQTRQMRAFAVQQLHLPDNASYKRYVDLHQPAVVWNVVAAPPDSLHAKTWCYWFVGCASYRGYFKEESAREKARALQADEGLEVAVQGVPAYSTLGKLDWLGGDPLLSTFVLGAQADAARVIFHELTHQKLYVQDDTVFNESYAVTVERLGVAQWLALQTDAAERQRWEQISQRRQDFRRLIRRTRLRLQAVYANKGEDWPARKQAVMQAFASDYEALKASWTESAETAAGFDHWVAHANNASFALQSAYDELVPGFIVLFDQQERDWPRFHAAVKNLGQWPQDERHACLHDLAQYQAQAPCWSALRQSRPEA